jgi:hypothetical protein
MPIRQIIGTFVSSSLFFLGTTAFAASLEGRDSAQYSFSAQYHPESEETGLPKYLPI